jgi:hypothetical protein
MSAPPGDAGEAAARDVADELGERAVLVGPSSLEAPAVHAQAHLGPDHFLHRGDRLVERLADAHRQPAREREPVGHRARPLPRPQRADDQRVRQLELAHQDIRDIGVQRPLMIGERLVDREIRVDRGAPVQALGRVRGLAVDLADDSQGPALRAHGLEACRLRDQAGRVLAVAFELGEAALAPVLLGADAVQHHLAPGRCRHEAVHRSDDAGLHVDAAAAVQAAVGNLAGEGIAAPRLGPDVDDVDVPAQRQARPFAGACQRESPELRALDLLAGPVAVRPELVLAQLGAQAERRAAFGEQLEHRLLAARQRRDADGCLEVVDEPCQGVGARAASSSSARAATCDLRTAEPSART